MKTKKKIIQKICSVCQSSDSCYITFADGKKIPYFSISLATGVVTCNHCMSKNWAK